MRHGARNAAFARELREAERRAQRPFGFRGPMGGGMSASGGPAPFNGDFAALAVTFGLTVNAFLRSDLGLSGSVGTGFAAWHNQVGAATDWVPGVGATDGIGQAGSSLNGKASLRGNGSTQLAAYVLGGLAPSVVNQHVWTIARVLALPSTGNGFLCGTSANGITAFVASGQSSPAANFTQFNAGGAGATTTGVVLNQWYEIGVSFTGSANDQITVGAHAPAAHATSDTAPATGRGWYANGAGANVLSGETMSVMHLSGPLAAFQAFKLAAGPLAQAFWTNAIEIAAA